MDHAKRRHVCIVVQNLPVPFDRRVWLECQVLQEAGYQVSVVCPKAPGDPGYQQREGVHLYKYEAFPPITRKIMFVAEYAYSIVATFLGLVRAYRRAPFRTVQVCNPPDVLWVAVLPFIVLFRVRLVYDQHDLCPELYESRFGAAAGLPYRALVAAERITYALSSRVIVVNESYRTVALGRGRKSPDTVAVVRTGPDADRLRPVTPDPELRRGRDYLLAYLGVMGPQDGVDLALRAMHHIVHVAGRTDIALTLLGDGDAGPELRVLAGELGLDDYVHFTGRAPDELVIRTLSTADVGLCPDPKNPLNDVSTMNKTMEYMAFELPVVAFDLVETRVSAAGAAAYAEPNRVEHFATTVLALLADDVRRKEMGEAGRRRVCEVLAWEHQAPAYLDVYEQLCGK